MHYHSLINKCTDHIRTHPVEDITAQDLADLCGYSLYHLSSVFRACLGCSVGRYIMEERLRLAAKMIRDGRKISEVAMDSGFDTGSGFTKAFRRQFGCSPREYKGMERGDSTAEDRAMMHGDNAVTDGFTHPVRAARAGSVTGPEFVKRSALKVYGYVIPVPEGHLNQDTMPSGKAAFWSHVDFKAFPSYPEGASDYAEIGTWINPDARTGRMEYFFGYVTSDPSPAEGFHEICLAPGDYAVFRLGYGHNGSGIRDGLPSQVQGLWQYVFDEWFRENGSVAFDDGRLCFEKYGVEDVEVCMPVRL